MNNEVPDETIQAVAKYINDRDNRSSHISVTTIDGDTQSPQYFEIIPFDQIDNSTCNFFAIDGSYNSKEFYNGLSVGVYTAGYVCYREGKQVRVNDTDDPLKLGQAYYPKNILVANEEHKGSIYDELVLLEPVQKFLQFLGADPEEVFAFAKELIVSSLSKLLSFCQEILEWSLVYEISQLSILQKGDFILRDGTLRTNNIKQKHLVKLGSLLNQKEVYIVAITKQSPIKLELSSTFRKIDSYLQDEKKPSYPFNTTNPNWQKICCWLEVPDDILIRAYPDVEQKRAVEEGKIPLVTRTSMYAQKSLTGGRGFGVFFVARLDYVEKLQNYDWLVADLNIYDVIPNIQNGSNKRDLDKISYVFAQLTRLTQEHYILGYPYPLVEAHNFVSIKDTFNEELMNRLKYFLYKDQRMDQVDIENLFLDIHERF